MRFFRTVIESFYSAPLYRQVQMQAGHGFMYSLKLVFVTAILTALLYAPTAQRLHREVFIGTQGRPAVMDDVFAQIAAQTPLMMMYHHKLVADERRAHTIRLRAVINGEVLEGDMITVDTTGATTHTNMPTPVLITATDIITQEKNEARIKSFKEILPEDGKPIRITPEYVEAKLGHLSQLIKERLPAFYALIGVVALLVGVFAMYLLRVFLLVVLALGGKLLAALLHVKIGFDGLMRLSAVSFTPVALLGAVITYVTAGSVSVLWILLCGWVMLAAAIAALREEGEVF